MSARATGWAGVDPEIAEALAGLPLDLDRLGPETLAEFRAMVAALLDLPADLAGVTIADRDVGSTTVRVVEPNAAATRERPCVVWIHGGGYVMGDYRMGDAELVRLCTTFDCICVSVAYRLAPEAPYPAPLDDCEAGLAWVVDNAGELGVDPARIGLMGASAGGGLAAGLALRARETGVELDFLVLLSPMLDDRQVSPSSRREAWTWTPSANRFGWQSYLGRLYGGIPPVDAAPGRAEQLSGLPRTFVRVGGADGFLDEDVAFAQRLWQAGVPTELHVYPGAPHGFESLAPGSKIALRAARDLDDWFGAVL